MAHLYSPTSAHLILHSLHSRFLHLRQENKNSTLNPSSVFHCSFDIVSLFTNVPLVETIQICADEDEHKRTYFSRKIKANDRLNYEKLAFIFLLKLFRGQIYSVTNRPPLPFPCKIFIE